MKFGKKVQFRLLAFLLSCVMCMTSFSMDGFVQTVNAAAAENNPTSLCQDPSDAKHATGLEERNTEDTVTEEYAVQDAQVETTENLPKEADNSQKMYFPAIGNQGGIGSCWAWAEIYYIMTYMYNRANNRKADSSNTFSPKWNYIQGQMPEVMGGVSIEKCPIDHFYYVSDLKNYPMDYLATEEDRYEALSVRPQWETVSYGNPSESNPTPITGPDDSDLDDIKQLLSDGEILYLGTSVYWFNYKTIVANSAAPANEAYKDQSIVVACAGTTGSDRGGHAMTIVGYNDEIGVDLNENGVIENAEKGAFKVANSWGTYYRNKGYVWISYDAFNLKSNYCKIGSAQTQTRISIADDILRMKIKTDSVKCYAQYTINIDNCVGWGSSSVCLNIGNRGIQYGVIGGIQSAMAADGVYNYSGTTGAADATFLMDLDVYKDVQWYDWPRDLGNIFEYAPYISFSFNSPNTNISIKDVHFVDAENGITYGAKLVSNNSFNKCFYVDKSNILPTVTNMTFDREVLMQNNEVKTTVLASDDKSGMKYEFAYQKVGGTDSATQSRSTSNVFTWTPKEAGTYRITVNITDSDGNVITKTVRKEVSESYQVTSLTPSIASGKVTATQKVTFEAGVSGAEGAVQYQYLIDGEVVRDYAADGKMTWNSVYKAYPYIITVKAKDSTGAVVTKEIEYNVNQAPYFGGYIFNPVSPVKAGQNVAVTISGGGGTGTLKRIVKVKKADGSYVTAAESSTSSTVNWKPGEAGTYTVQMILEDENGITASYEQPYTVEEPENRCVVYYENSSFSQAYIHYRTGNGVWTAVPGVAMTATTEQSGYRYKYVIDLGTESTATLCFNNGSGNWDSKNGANYQLGAGTYGIKNQVVTALSTVSPTPVVTAIPTVKPTATVSPTVTPTITPTVSPTATPGTNKTTIYYTGYSTPHIHYKIGNGAWTNAPGAAMTASTEQDGYTHKITIDMGIETTLTACFNDGNGNWDSNNGANDTFGVGTYGYSGGKIVTIDEGLKIDSFQTSTAVGGTNTRMTLSVSASGGTAPYKYSYGYVYDGKTVSLGTNLSATEISFYPSNAGVYQFTMQVQDAAGKTVTKTIDNFTVEGPKVTLTAGAASPQKTGTSITLTGEACNLVYYSQYAGYTYTVSKDGVTTTLTTNSDNTATWTPTVAGTYTIKVNYTDTSGNNLSADMQYVIQDVTLNQTTIYYKGYTNPNIHYRVGDGLWTNAPGIAMTPTIEKTGYTHKITIDLGTATTLTACFNDGNGNWDSKNGANYTFGAGTYTYSNGTITKID